MLGIYYLLALIFFGVIVYWSIQNDSVAPGEPTKGLLRMKRDAAAKTPGENASANRSSRVAQRD